MSKNYIEFEERDSTKAGFNGEDVILESLKACHMCWRGDNTGLVCPNEFAKKHVWKSDRSKKADYDISVKLDCSGCPELLKHISPNTDMVKMQHHEVKTNIAAYDDSLTSNKSHTGNVYLERKQCVDGVCIGSGWFDKYAEEQTFPDWIHFYQPYDSYERENIERKNNSKPPYTNAASDEDIEAWENDPNVEDGAVLITKWPLELCISIRGRDLYKAIKNGDGIVKTKNAYLIPIRNMIPHVICSDGNTGTTMEEVFTEHTDGFIKVRSMSIWSYVIKGEHGKQRKGHLPQWKYEYVFLPPIFAEWVKNNSFPETPFSDERIYKYQGQGKKAYPNTDINKWLQLPTYRFIWLSEGHLGVV